jgi:hypothetical protein
VKRLRALAFRTAIKRATGASPLAAVPRRQDSSLRGARVVSQSCPMFAFDNSYARLPNRFYARIAPTKVAGPRVVKVNQTLADPGGRPSRATGTDAPPWAPCCANTW